MTDPSLGRFGGVPVDLVEKLRAAVRGEFQAAIYIPAPDDPVLGRGACTVKTCRGLAWSKGLCSSHHARWRRAGRPDLDSFCATALPRPGQEGPRGHEIFDLRRLPTQLRLEVQFALQCRHDERGAALRRGTVAQVVQLLGASAVGSLLDRPLEHWLLLAQQGPTDATRLKAFLRDCYARVEDLVNNGDPDAVYKRDVWDARRLGVAVRGGHYTVRFDRVSQAWLKSAAKQWARFRLATAHSLSTIRNDVLAIGRLSDFMSQRRPSAVDESVITRPFLEDYLSWLAASGLDGRTRLSYLVALRIFFEHCRRHEWLPRLAAKATLYGDDFPILGESLPRFIPEYVMGQLESEANLSLIADPSARNLVVLLIETGLRAGDGCALPLDPIIRDGDGSACLAFFNSKVRAEQLVPLSEKAVAAIRAQQDHVRQRWPGGATCLFPRLTANPDGTRPFVYATLNAQLLRWQNEIGVHDERGRPVRVTAHRFRHTLGTRLINSDVPQHIVQKLLGHASPEMTAVYAHLHDATLRKAFDDYQTQRVNISGEPLAYDPLTITADAEWIKHNLARVHDSLPNGYCGRPAQQDCPHPNACLTCPDFQTTPEFLPVHRQQADTTRILIATAETDGHFRLAANHRKVLDNLNRIIPALEAIQADSAGDHAS